MSMAYNTIVSAFYPTTLSDVSKRAPLYLETEPSLGKLTKINYINGKSRGRLILVTLINAFSRA